MKLPNFRNGALLLQALTHSTYAYEHPNEGPDNERLEFLGDSIVEFVVRDLMFARYPSMDEGEMSKRVDQLVDESCLASISVQLSIPPKLRLGSGSQHERDNPGVQADAFESVIGAYRLDSGIGAVYEFSASIFTPLVEKALELKLNDSVSEFQEYVHANLSPSPPEYRLMSAAGPDHAKTYELAVCVGDRVYGIGKGSSKKEARRNAAAEALRQLGLNP
jgi:ribonuclease-3